ncbi:unnamed protein product [Heterobilharzia americana]|nr:unnamed protein product [Heterobilharzia americana]
MEYLGQYQGFVLYSTDITHLNDTSAFDLKFSQLRGDGLVYTWSETDQYIFHGYIHEYTVSKEISMLSYSPAQTLLILLQNKGYSKQLYTRRSEAKGLGSVFFNDQELLNWWNEPLKQPYVDASDISSGLFNVTK